MHKCLMLAGIARTIEKNNDETALIPLILCDAICDGISRIIPLGEGWELRVLYFHSSGCENVLWSCSATACKGIECIRRMHSRDHEKRHLKACAEKGLVLLSIQVQPGRTFSQLGTISFARPCTRMCARRIGDHFIINPLSLSISPPPYQTGENRGYVEREWVCS